MMSRFLHLVPSERSLVLRSLLLVAAIRLALWVAPLSRLREFLSKPLIAAAFPSHLVQVPVERLAWVVQAASRRIPAASCLTQSLALQFLLSRSGHASSIRIGVAKDPESGFQAHAWVDCGGQIMLNRPEEVAGYTRLASLDSM
jgi:hypothetical protein